MKGKHILFLPMIILLSSWMLSLSLSAQEGYPASSYRLSSDGKTLVRWLGAETEVDLATDTKLSEVTQIAKGAFVGTKVQTFSSGHVTVIDGGLGDGEGIFEMSRSLKRVALPKVTSLGVGSFFACLELEQFVAPELEVLDTGALAGCKKMIQFEASRIRTVAMTAFSGCISLPKLVLPQVETLGRKALEFTFGLKEIHLGPNLRALSDSVFFQMHTLRTIYCEAVLPPICTNDPFVSEENATQPSAMTLYVPAQALDSYRMHPQWSRVGKILPLSASDMPWAGLGSQESPYLIGRSADLNQLALLVAGGNTFAGKHFRLTQHIDYGYDQTGEASRMIGEWHADDAAGNARALPFEGIFDGAGYTVDNAFFAYDNHLGGDREEIESGGGVGLFGYVGQGGKISNLTIGANCVMQGGDRVGGIVGILDGTLTMSRSYATLRGKSGVGGVVGDAIGTIDRCFYQGAMSGLFAMGGLIGYANNECALTNSYTRPTMTFYTQGDDGGSNRYFGGIVGVADRCTLNHTYAAGTMLLPERATARGGICGIWVTGMETFSHLYFDKESFGIESASSNAENPDMDSPIQPTTVGLSGETMKAGDFLTLLSGAFEQDKQRYNDGYPILTGFDYQYVSNRAVESSAEAAITIVGRNIHIDCPHDFHVALYDMSGRLLIMGPNLQTIAQPDFISILVVTSSQGRTVQRIAPAVAL